MQNSKKDTVFSSNEKTILLLLITFVYCFSAEENDCMEQKENLTEEVIDQNVINRVNEMITSLENLISNSYKTEYFSILVNFASECASLVNLLKDNFLSEWETSMRRFIKVFETLSKMNQSWFYSDCSKEQDFGKQGKKVFIRSYNSFLNKLTVEQLTEIVIMNYVRPTVDSKSYRREKYLELWEKLEYCDESLCKNIANIFSSILITEEFRAMPMDSTLEVLYAVCFRLKPTQLPNVESLGWNDEKLKILHKTTVDNGLEYMDSKTAEDFFRSIYNSVVIYLKDYKSLYKFYAECWHHLSAKLRMSSDRNSESVKLLFDILYQEVRRVTNIARQSESVNIVKELIAKDIRKNYHHRDRGIFSLIRSSLDKNDWNALLLEVIEMNISQRHGNSHFLSKYIPVEENDPNLPKLIECMCKCIEERSYFISIIAKYKTHPYLEGFLWILLNRQGPVPDNIVIPRNISIVVTNPNTNQTGLASEIAMNIIEARVRKYISERIEGKAIEKPSTYDSDIQIAQSILDYKEFFEESRICAARILFHKANDKKSIEKLIGYLQTEKYDTKFYNALLDIALVLPKEYPELNNLIFDLFLIHYEEHSRVVRSSWGSDNYNIDKIFRYLSELDISFVFSHIIPVLKRDISNLKSIVEISALDGSNREQDSEFIALCLSICANIKKKKIHGSKRPELVKLFFETSEVETLIESYSCLPEVRKILRELAYSYREANFWKKVCEELYPEDEEKAKRRRQEAHSIVIDRYGWDHLRTHYDEDIQRIANLQELLKNETPMINFLFREISSETFHPWRFIVFFKELRNVYKKCSAEQKKDFKQRMANWIVKQDWKVYEEESKGLSREFSEWLDKKIESMEEVCEELIKKQ